MASYLLLLHSGYAPASEAVAISAASGQLVLGPNNVDPRVLASGNSRSGPFQWHWSVVRKDDLSPDAKANKPLLVFPFLRSTSDRGGGKPIAVPFRKFKQLPKWVTPYTLGTLSNSTGLARIQSLSDPASAAADGFSSQTQAGSEYSLFLSFYNDNRHVGWKVDTKLGDYPELLVADNFASEQSEFLMFVGRNETDLYDYDTSQWPTTKQGGDAVPWASIITFILSFVLSKKSGKSTSAAALTGLAAGGATYLLADPSNPDNLFGIGVDSGSTAPGTTPPATTTPSGSTGAGSLGQAIGGAINGAGNVISNMGPGTAALVGGAAGLTLAGKSNWLLWGGLAIGAYLLLKD